MRTAALPCEGACSQPERRISRHVFMREVPVYRDAKPAPDGSAVYHLEPGPGRRLDHAREIFRCLDCDQERVWGAPVADHAGAAASP
jgi:hypothetical protein